MVGRPIRLSVFPPISVYLSVQAASTQRTMVAPGAPAVQEADCAADKPRNRGRRAPGAWRPRLAADRRALGTVCRANETCMCPSILVVPCRAHPSVRLPGAEATGIRILCMAAKQGPKALFCTPNRSKCILFVSLTRACHGMSRATDCFVILWCSAVWRAGCTARVYLSSTLRWGLLLGLRKRHAHCRPTMWHTQWRQ
jgi:hypothetical protein